MTAKASAQNGDTAFVVDAGPVRPRRWPSPRRQLGRLSDDHRRRAEVAAAGDQVVTVRPADPAAWKAMNLASVTLTRTGD